LGLKYPFYRCVEGHLDRVLGVCGGVKQAHLCHGFLTFSSVAFNSDMTDALFYTEHLCGLCGGGEFVLMRKTGGNWMIANWYGTWVS
jgi:hypothetical protein